MGLLITSRWKTYSISRGHEVTFTNFRGADLQRSQRHLPRQHRDITASPTRRTRDSHLSKPQRFNDIAFLTVRRIQYWLMMMLMPRHFATGCEERDQALLAQERAKHRRGHVTFARFE